eukprot:CAMPEP_0173259564 /NCGR_PEP_ID=MMETSP1142-20121109/25066_1 /TAXON_ID=483371 /ORGANISM="non described non described, Strain CCMP2298" /LENGTH=411 /DNA_ID=CAMNT_0014194159 /DNA_START=109 /DNA_END=1344 /DNA_ORIENTATION=-
MSTTDNHVCVVGAGLAGTLTALLLAKLGIRVSLFEKRADLGPAEEVSSAFGASTSATKRSINLALSHRGMCALREIGALDEIMQHAVRMPCRVIHSVDAPDVKQAYGTANEAIWSVSRQLINSVLLRRASQHPGIKIHFGYSFVNSTAEGRCTFKVEGSDKGEGEEKGEEAKGGAGAGEGVFEEVYDLIIGADGAYSGVRESMLKKGRVNFSRQYIGHGYMELTIPAKVVPADAGAEERLDFALACPEGLHIWPRGEFMLIATATPVPPCNGAAWNNVPCHKCRVGQHCYYLPEPDGQICACCRDPRGLFDVQNRCCCFDCLPCHVNSLRGNCMVCNRADMNVFMRCDYCTRNFPVFQQEINGCENCGYLFQGCRDCYETLEHYCTAEEEQPETDCTVEDVEEEQPETETP